MKPPKQQRAKAQWCVQCKGVGSIQKQKGEKQKERLLWSRQTWLKQSKQSTWQLPCPAGHMTLPRAIMVQWMTVLDAEVSATLVTGQFHHLPLPAARTFTLIGEDLRRSTVCYLRNFFSFSPMKLAYRFADIGIRNWVSITNPSINYLPCVFAARDQNGSLCQCALPLPGQEAPLWPPAQAHYRGGTQVPGYPIVKGQESV